MPSARYLLYITFWAVGLSACQPDTGSPSLNEGQAFIDSLQLEYAPDKRVAIWEINLVESPQGWVLKGKTNLPKAQQQLQQWLAQNNITWLDSIQLLPQPELGEQTFGIVTLSACNIRSQAKHSAELATQSTLGTLLKIWEKNGDWYRVQTPDGYLGWLDAGGLQLIDQSDWDNYTQSERVVFLPHFGFSYTTASTSSQPVSDLLAGNILVRTGTAGDFTRVAYPDGRTAYVPTSMLMDWSSWLASQRPTAQNILHTAETMLGRPYLWGGTSGKAFDCSGFTKTVFYLNGLILPRDASQQIHVGRPLQSTAIDQLQAGDLLFFGRAATEQQKEKITHVAIYMGDHKIIHATGRVQIESLNPNDPDFAEARLLTFVRATRPLESAAEYGIPALSTSEWY